MLFKILKDGRSFHGGDMQYDLPVRSEDGTWTPGNWHKIEGPLAPCSRGLHVTDKPAEWWDNGAVAWVAEVDGEQIPHENNKICVRAVRLTRQATDAELADRNVYFTGHWKVSAGRHAAWGSASVEAWGSASVEASGSASVEAWGSASVKASGSVSVKAWDSASVKASGSASVKASGSVSVKAWGSASVEAWDSASVEAWDSASVKAWGSASVEAWDSASVEASGSASVANYGSGTHTPTGYAVLIDRSHTPPRIVCGWSAAEVEPEKKE